MYPCVNWLAEPKLEERRLAVPRGNAPRSAAYRAAALLLSYRTALICGFNPKRTGRNTKFSLATGLIRMTRLAELLL
jgi:hypothetical protein